MREKVMSDTPRLFVDGLGIHLAEFYEGPHYRAELEQDIIDLLTEYQQRYGRASYNRFIRQEVVAARLTPAADRADGGE